jgi:glycosyltransferase involved in cell wall biosynthesis
MNIAFVTQALPYLPCRDGFRLYAANVLRSLARRHRVDLISLLRDDDDRHLDWAREHCATLSTLPLKKGRNVLAPVNLVATYAWGRPFEHRGKMSSLLTAGMRSRQWDVLHVEGGYAGGLIPSRLPLPRVLSLHDSWKLRCAQMAKCGPTWRERLYYNILNQIEPRYERLVYPRFDRCVVVGGTDAIAIRSLAPSSQVAIIPNGIDTEYYHPAPARMGGASLVFHGNLEYAPNVQAAMEFSREIFPLIQRQVPQAEFHLVGAKPAKQIREMASWPGIRLSADLPDLRNALCSSRVYVCPMRYGTGVKNKLLEAMALGLPIISYPEAIQGITCTPGKHLLLADDPQGFARLALDLLHDPQRGEEMGRAARQLVEEDFSWESRAESFEGLYLEAIEAHGSRGNLRRLSRQARGGQALALSEEAPAERLDA